MTEFKTPHDLLHRFEIGWKTLVKVPKRTPEDEETFVELQIVAKDYQNSTVLLGLVHK